MDVRLRQCLCVRMRRGSVHDLAIVQSQELHHCFVTRPETRIVVCVSVDVGVCVCECTVPSPPFLSEWSGSCFHSIGADVPTKLYLIVSRGARIVLIRPRAPTSERGTIIGTPWRILSARYQR